MKKWGSAAQKLIFEVGSDGGQEIYILVKLVSFISSKDHFWVLVHVYGFGVNKSYLHNKNYAPVIRSMKNCWLYLAVMARNITGAIFPPHVDQNF